MPLNNSRGFTVPFDIAAVNVIKTLVQIKAGVSTPIYIKRARCEGDAAAAAPLAVSFVRKSAVATVTSFTPNVLGDSFGTAVVAQAVGGVSATGVNASAEGTDTDVHYADEVSAQSGGGYFLDLEDGEFMVRAGGIIALKIIVAPTSVRLRGFVEFFEIG